MATPRQRLRRGRQAANLAFDAEAQALVGQEMLEASHAVIARRLEIAQAAFGDPAGADLRELSLMGSEKAEALSAATASLVGSGADAMDAAARAAQTELHIARRATRAALSTTSPTGMAMVQANYAMGLWGRAWGRALTLGAASLDAQADAMRPIHAAAVANARRLKRE